MNELQKKLYQKAQEEHQNFIKELQQSTAEEVIARAYELVMRENFLIIFENENLTDTEVKKLLELEHPLAECYEEWLGNDYSYMDMLRDTISDLVEDLCEGE
ncbi:MAG: DUF3848 domain-containing protein [Hominilimicola sp.]